MENRNPQQETRNDPPKPRPFAPEGTGWGCLYVFVFVLAVTALIASFGLAYYVDFLHPDTTDLKCTLMKDWPCRRIAEALVLISWIVIPPIWFWFECVVIYGKRAGFGFGKDAPKDWDRFKYLQDLASKVWLAVVTALLMLYFGKDLKL
jgi:hypothetical protein